MVFYLSSVFQNSLFQLRMLLLRKRGKPLPSANWSISNGRCIIRYKNHVHASIQTQCSQISNKCIPKIELRDSVINRSTSGIKKFPTEALGDWLSDGDNHSESESIVAQPRCFNAGTWMNHFTTQPTTVAICQLPQFRVKGQQPPPPSPKKQKQKQKKIR